MPLHRLSALVLLLALPISACAQQPGEPPVLNYDLIDPWPLGYPSAIGAPGPWNFVQVSSVAVNSNGNILVLHRGAHPIIEFTSDGKFVRSWGGDLISEGKVFTLNPEDQVEGRTIHSVVHGPAGCTACGAHSIRVDPEGSIWVVDASGYVIYKMNQAAEVAMELGTKGVSGTGRDTFNLPTDIAFGPDGSIYVSDGYANERVVKFSPDGDYLLEWGTRGTGPSEFFLPHNLAVDAQSRVYVTDRENQRIEVFDSQGTFLDEWRDVGGISALFIDKEQRLWAGDRLFDLDGNVLGRLPGRPGPHGMAVADDGTVYVGLLSGAVLKFIRK